MFEACRRRDWAGGFALRDWRADPYDPADAAEDDDCVSAKPGQQVVADYSASRA